MGAEVSHFHQQDEPGEPHTLQQVGADPDIATLAQKLELPEAKVRQILKIAKEPISLDLPVADDSDATLGDFIKDTGTIAPAQAAISPACETSSVSFSTA